MRNVSPEATNAITIPVGFKATARLTAYKSRIFFSSTTNNAPAWALPIGSTDYPIPESAGYVTAVDKLITVAINDSKVKFLVEGSAATIIPTSGGSPLTTDPKSRPGIYQNTIYWHDGSVWKRAVYDPALLVAGNPACITSQATFASLGKGSIQPVSTTEAVVFLLDEGGIRPAFVSNNGTVTEHLGRIFDPTIIWSESEDDHFYKLHYTAAVKVGTKIYAYCTAHNGSVKGTIFKLAPDGERGTWSDFLIVVPEDLSTFLIGNAFTYDDRIFLCGQFSRSDEYASATKYTLLLWSDDGKTFSLDRRTLIAAIDLRFMVDLADDEVVISSTNRHSRDTAPYQVIKEEANNTIVTLDTVRGNAQNGFSAKADAHDEVYIDDPYIDTGTYAKLEIGVNTTAGTEYIKYHDLVIAKVTAEFADGVRNYDLQLLADGIWHTASMTHPFYLELMGKQSILDPLTDMGNFYPVGTGGGYPWTLTCDFWTEEAIDPDSQGLEPFSHEASSETTHWCRDLLDICTEYPELPDDATITVRIFGWSRGGYLSWAPEVEAGDPTPPATPNDEFSVILLIENADGTQDIVESTPGELSSDYANPPQTYFPEGVRAGSYPVEYEMTNPGAGKKIVKVGVTVTNTTGTTTYYLERIEFPDINAYLIPTTYQEIDTFERETEETFTVDVNDLDDQLGEKSYLHILKVINTSTAGRLDYHVKFTAPNDGVFHVYGIKASMKLIDQWGYYGGVDNSVKDIWVNVQAVEEHTDTSEFLVTDTPPRIAMCRIDQDFTIPPGLQTTIVFSYYATYPDLWGPYDHFIAELFIESKTPATEETEETITSHLTNTQKGIPQLLFAQRPYSAWNFDTIARVRVLGDYSYCGCLGLAEDDDNYVLGYIRVGYAGIAVVRGGKRTTLIEEAADILSDIVYDMRFWHRDGEFGLEYKTEDTVAWPNRGSQLVYSWLEADGALATLDDIFHVGYYSYIDPPRFRTTGFRSSQTIIPVMPLDIDIQEGNSDFINDFEWAGQVDIDGRIYNYTGKNLFFEASDPLGPFQFRMVLDWQEPYTEGLEGYDSYTYQGGLAVEFWLFRWWTGAAHANDYAGAVMGMSNGYSWLNEETQWMTWITTGGYIVVTRERSRHYSESIPEMSNQSTADKIWITHGLIGVTPQEETDTETVHAEGAFVFIHSNDKTEIIGFFAASGEHDMSITTLLEKFTQIAGTSASFPGDTTPDDITLDSGEEVAV